MRHTNDIDVLMSEHAHTDFTKKLIGRGYLPRFKGATRNFKKMPGEVPLDIIVEGENPGYNCPVPFPSPKSAVFITAGVNWIDCAKFIDLKLGAALTNPKRKPKDEADVLNVIEYQQLGEEFTEKLHPFVQQRYRELVQLQQQEDEPKQL